MSVEHAWPSKQCNTENAVNLRKHFNIPIFDNFASNLMHTSTMIKQKACLASTESCCRENMGGCSSRESKKLTLEVVWRGSSGPSGYQLSSDDVLQGLQQMILDGGRPGKCLRVHKGRAQTSCNFC